MNAKFSPHTLLSLATIFTLSSWATILVPLGGIAPSIAAAKSARAKSERPNSNMIFPTAGSKNQRGSNVERAKEAMFRDGDYVKAKQFLDLALQTEPQEPLAYGMSALYPFSAGDYEKVKEYGEKTLKAAEQLTKTNPLRGNLYRGVAMGILGAYEFKKANGGALGALSKLQKVFEYIDKAKKINPNDPELNLVKGYMDLLLAVNLPFSDTSDAIEQLKKAEPKYLSWRGLYIGYRDLKEYDKAARAIDNALKIAPQNPEFAYYKAQLLGIQGRERQNEKMLRESIKLFESAYQKRDRLLISTLAQILSERCQAKSVLMKTKIDVCYGFEAQLKQDNPNTVVGLTKLPALD